MADISLATADKINVGTLTVQQHTFIANEAITAGAPVYIVSASGKVANADGNGSAPINTCHGIATKTVAAGEAVTVVRRGLLEGYVFDSQSYGAKIFVSDNVGRLADAAGTTSIVVGTIVPVFDTPLGTGANKALLVECNANLG